MIPIEVGPEEREQMLEVNCDDSLDVMKRLREHRAVIIRDNRHDSERRREGERRPGERVDGQEKVQRNKMRGAEKKKRQQVLSPSQ